MKFANDILNYMSPDQIKEFQEEKLRRQLKYCYNNSEFYRRKFEQAGAQPGDIQTIEDFRKLPILMTKKDERESQQESIEKYGHPFGVHLCARLEELELAASTSGTTGTPTFTYIFSKRDVNGPVAELYAFMFRYAGIQPGDRVLFAYALGVSSTSMILWGIRKMGALPIDVDVRAGADEVLHFAELTKPTAASMTPSLAEYLIEKAPQSIDKEIGDLGIKSLLLCGEPGVGNLEVRRRLESAYNGRVYDFWSPGGLGFGLSCSAKDYYGLHCFAPDYNLYQDDLIDPETKKPISIVDGAIGETVHTSLDRDASPMVRYAYGDIVQVFTKECPGCGFKGKRLKFMGRADNMLIAKGFNFYPEAVKEIISTFIPRVTGEMKIILDTPPPKVKLPLKIKIEYGRGVEEQQLRELGMQIKAALDQKIKISAEIIWATPNTLEKSLQKTSPFEAAY